MKMNRNAIAGGLAVVVVAVSLCTGGRLLPRPGRAPISALGTGVYYSAVDEWTEFYQRRVPAGTGWVHLPKTISRSEFQSGIVPAERGYLAPQDCAECHADLYHACRDTAHERTSSLATRQTVKGDFHPPRHRLATKDPRLYFEMSADQQRLTQCVVVDRGKRSYEYRRTMDLVIGSGTHGQTYLYWEGDQLFQLPVSFLAESGWINSPGNYRDGTADFARGVGARCLECHATFFASDAAEYNRHDRSNYILGVTCVRCHGPGWAHVQFHRNHPQEKTARYIVNPVRLPQVRANEVCGQCHGGVGQSKRPAFAYQPGEPLADYVELDLNPNHPTSSGPHANQLQRMMQSQCYLQSDGMTCLTCHDAHHNERRNLTQFIARCRRCHEPEACGPVRQHGATLHSRCLECHMPSRRDAKGAMETRQGQRLPMLRDHLIRAWPDVTARVLAELKLAAPSP